MGGGQMEMRERIVNFLGDQFDQRPLKYTGGLFVAGFILGAILV